MKMLFNRNWKFSLNQPHAPHLNSTDDANWRTVQLPHDWSAELPFSQEKGASCTGFLPGGMGWYRKHFATSPEMFDGTTLLMFDGVYNNADFYINGTHVGFHPYGYTPYAVELTPWLKPLGQDNVVAVRVDHTRYADSRWYTGSGIYRDVELYVLPKTHIAPFDIQICPTICGQEAVVEAKVQVVNTDRIAFNGLCILKIRDADGTIQAVEEASIAINGNDQSEIHFAITLQKPTLWDIDHPILYEACVELSQQDRLLQNTSVPFGIRTFEFTKDQGFFLNQRHVLIQGVCLHHEAGCVGAAVPDEVWERRLRLLKECGCNAIRTAHNPPSARFLDLCDRMGFLVQEEFFDEWYNPKDKFLNGTEQSVQGITEGYCRHFERWAKTDLQMAMRRDRNHPCIIQWSIGNEIEWTYPQYNKASGYFGINADGSYFWNLPPNSRETTASNLLAVPRCEHDVDQTARELVAYVKEMDTSRPVTANLILPSISYETGYASALDMVGFSYRRVIYDYAHRQYPEQPIMGTENVPQWHEWKGVLDHPFVAGLFLWTGIDYLGEIHAQTDWPSRSTHSGLLDTAGFPRASYYMMKSIWQKEPTAYLTTQKLADSLYEQDAQGELIEREKDGWQRRLWFWPSVNRHWNYQPNEPIVVEALTNASEAELFLNGVSQGVAKLDDYADHILKWLVPFSEGELKVVAQGVEDVLETVDDPVQVNLHLASKNDKILQIEGQLVDTQGRCCTHTEREVSVALSSNLSLLGIDNGSPRNVQPFRSEKITTCLGRFLLIVQTEPTKELAVIKASIMEGLTFELTIG